MVTKLFWEDKFHAINGKAQACTQCALVFVLLSVLGGGGGRRIFFIYPGSQCVITIFLSSSQWVPNVFPQMFSKAPRFFLIWRDNRWHQILAKSSCKLIHSPCTSWNCKKQNCRAPNGRLFDMFKNLPCNYFWPAIWPWANKFCAHLQKKIIIFLEKIM
jgi:hypothetical protein